MVAIIEGPPHSVVSAEEAKRRVKDSFEHPTSSSFYLASFCVPERELEIRPPNGQSKVIGTDNDEDALSEVPRIARRPSET
jgi:hypothetical protein